MSDSINKGKEPEQTAMDVDPPAPTPAKREPKPDDDVVVTLMCRPEGAGEDAPSECVAIERKYLAFCKTIDNLITDSDSVSVVPVPNVSKTVMEHVLRWCKIKFDENKPDKTIDDYKDHNLDEWEEAYCKSIEWEEFLLTINASNYLEAQQLMYITCKYVSGLIEGKTPEEIRQLLHIANDFTPEEEEEIRKQNAWCEDKFWKSEITPAATASSS